MHAHVFVVFVAQAHSNEIARTRKLTLFVFECYCSPFTRGGPSKVRAEGHPALSNVYVYRLLYYKK